MTDVTDEQKAKLEADNEKRKQEIQQKQTQASASATTPRSRQATTYIILRDCSETHEEDRFELTARVVGRSPQAAIADAQENDPALKDDPALVAVPESAWHLFRRTSTFEEVKIGARR